MAKSKKLKNKTLMNPIMPAESVLQPAHLGSQSMSPTKESNYAGSITGGNPSLSDSVEMQ